MFETARLDSLGVGAMLFGTRIALLVLCASTVARSVAWEKALSTQVSAMSIAFEQVNTHYLF